MAGTRITWGLAGPSKPFPLPRHSLPPSELILQRQGPENGLAIAENVCRNPDRPRHSVGGCYAPSDLGLRLEIFTCPNLGKIQEVSGAAGPFRWHDHLAYSVLAQWQLVLLAPALGSHPEGRAGVCRGQGSPQVTIDGCGMVPGDAGPPALRLLPSSLAHSPWAPLLGPPDLATRRMPS